MWQEFDNDLNRYQLQIARAIMHAFLVDPKDHVVTGRRARFEETGTTLHPNYEKAYKREVRNQGRRTPRSA